MLGAMSVAAPAWAQVDQPDDRDDEVAVQSTPPADRQAVVGQPEELGEIVVTGSRIQRRDLTSSSPLTVVQDEEFELSGTVNVEQVLNTLPQVIPGTTSFSNNPGNGAATLDLRGLGTTRTLVLVNGRRYFFFDANQVVDLNTIPSFLLDSVDVVTGGASAVYGSDALAGVVNFRLMNDLNGIKAGTQYNITEEGDGSRFNAYLAVGAELPDGRGNVVAYGEYFKRDAIFQGDRPFSTFAAGEACITPGSTNPSTGVGTPFGGAVSTCTTRGGELGLAPGGSSTPPFGRFRDFLGTTGSNFNRGAGIVFDGPGGPVRNAVQPQDLYNYAPVNYLQLPQERFLLGGYGEFEITEGLIPFVEVAFANNRVQQELAATPVTGFFDINVNSIAQFLNADTLARFRRAAAATGDPNVIERAFVQRRTTETGARNSFDERNAFRVLGGVKGSIVDDLNYESYYFYARTRNANVQQGNISRSAFAAGLNGTGTPINIFGPNTLTQAQVDAISITAQNNDISTLQVANAAITGNLFFTSPLASNSIGFAVGGEYRSVSAQFIPDTALSSGDVIGFNAADPTEGGYNVREGFAELLIPLIENRFIDRLQLTAAYRYSDYSLRNVGGVHAYAGGVEFSPIRDLTLRGQYQRAVRAPNVDELFSGGGIGFPNATDPCSSRNTTNRTDAIRQLCIAQGVPAGAVFTSGVQINDQIPSRFGGNPDLEEETSDTYTVGAVFRPRFIPRLSITVDYFDISIDDTISTIGTNTVFDLCFNRGDPGGEFCQLINRNAAGIISGEQFSVNTLGRNIASLEVKGVDLQVDYSQPLGFSLMGGEESRLNFFFLGTYTDESNFTPIANIPEGEITCAGEFGITCGEPTPEYKWTSRLSFIDGPGTISFRWRHLSSVDDDAPNTDNFVEEIDDYNLFDLSFRFDVNDNFTITTGVNNIFDKKPPILGNNQEQANTFPSTYDVLGRDFFISADIRF